MHRYEVAVHGYKIYTVYAPNDFKAELLAMAAFQQEVKDLRIKETEIVELETETKLCPD